MKMFRRQMYEAMFISLVIIVVISALVAICFALLDADLNQCAQYADTAVKDVPARCMQYWGSR